MAETGRRYTVVETLPVVGLLIGGVSGLTVLVMVIVDYLTSRVT